MTDGSRPTDTSIEHLDFPIRWEDAFSEPSEYERLRNQDSIPRVALPGGRWAWLVTRYSDFRAILSDPRFSADSTRHGFPLVNVGVGTARAKYRSFVTMDPPEHTRYRKLLAGEFSPRTIEAARPKIASRVDALLDAMLEKGPPSDIVNDLALPTASGTICDILGIDYSHHAYFYSKANVLISNHSSREEIESATQELCEVFLARLIAEKKQTPSDDLLSRLVSEQAGGQYISEHEIISLARVLLIAGYETTANVIAMSILALLQNPDQMAALKWNPALLTTARDELLRYTDVTHAGVRRIAIEDVAIGDIVIRKGEGVILSNTSANRDCDAFEDPHRCDIFRKARHHVAFGHGIHQCIAHYLARVELEVVLERILHAIPEFRLVNPAGSLPLKHDTLVFGLESLPITWHS